MYTDFIQEDGTYIGNKDNNKKHGKGTFEYTNGNKYVGDWVNDMQHGDG